MDYAEITALYEEMDTTSKRLHKTYLLSEFLKKTKTKDVESVMLLIAGKVFPIHDSRKIGVATKLVMKALALATGSSPETVENEWKNIGDLGLVAQNLLKKKRQATLGGSKITTEKVFTNLRKLAVIEGSGSVDKKLKLIAELLTSATPVEAKYIVRTVLEQMRVGLGEGSIRDAIVWAFFGKEAGVEYDQENIKLIVEDRKHYNSYVDAVQRAYDLTADFTLVVKTIQEKGLAGLEQIDLVPGRPVKVMLVQKADTVKEAFEMVGTPAAIEYKYDGFRMLIHKMGDDIRMFTRRLEDVTKQFPDVVKIVQENVKAKICIIDAEAAGYDQKTGRHLPFQIISQRIKRKHNIEEVAQKFPVEVIVFDILLHEGDTLTGEPYHKRRKILTSIVQTKKLVIRPSDQIVTDNEERGTKFYHAALDEGYEGVMFKNTEGIYKPGSRVGFCVKLKPTMETLQLIIVAAEWGTGKRGKWLSSVVLATTDAEGNLLEIGKCSTGLKDKPEEGFSYPELTALLRPLITKEDGRAVRVKPKILVDVDYEEIQVSQNYSSGFALRFPRFVRLRDDLGVEDVNTLEDVKRFYKQQRGRDKE